MRSYEFSGKTIDKAIKEGLETLGKKQEDVDIKIISEGGLFKKAKVVINIEDEADFNTNFKNKEEAKEEAKKEVEQKAEPKPEKKEEPHKAQPKEEPKPRHNLVEEVKVVEPKAEVKEEKLQEQLEEKQNRYEEKHFENNKTSVEFIQGLMDSMKLETKVSLEERRDSSNILIETEDAGKVIGYRGDCLTAIQYIANIVESNSNPNAKRVVVDSGDYKQKREETLRNLAIRVASKVESTGRTYKLEPMNAFERRIIHTELQNYPSVDTHSEGVEPNRRIVVTKKK